MQNKWFYNDTFIHICHFSFLTLIPFLFSPIPPYLLFISVFSELFIFWFRVCLNLDSIYERKLAILVLLNLGYFAKHGVLWLHLCSWKWCSVLTGFCRYFRIYQEMMRSILLIPHRELGKQRNCQSRLTKSAEFSKVVPNSVERQPICYHPKPAII